jgi:uncharacterized protein YjbJ (UPF0337 family)
LEGAPGKRAPEQEAEMNWDQVRGQWQQLQGNAKERWGKLTDDELMEVEGNRDKLEGRIQERYGYSKERVKREVDEWISDM